MQNMLPPQSVKIDALRQNIYFSRLNDDALVQLAQKTSLRHYEPGEIICWQGESCSGLFIIERGSVKLFKVSVKGRELIIKVFEEGATFNEVPVFDRGLNVVNVAALEPCDIWIVDPDEIRHTLKNNPDMTEAVITNLSRNLRMLVELVEELSFFQVTNRMARLLSQLPMESSQGLAIQRITQDQLAARLGTVREVASRSLRELERSGAIRVQRRQIEILDQNILLDWAQGPIPD